MILSEIEGEPIPWLGLKDLIIADESCRLIILAINKLHSLTPKIISHEIASVLPHKTLLEELNTINKNSTIWKENLIFRDSLELMNKIIPQVTTPLVFSNGDYNPLNFIIKNKVLVGWIDFEHACFEDPYIGLAKIILWADDDYGWGVGSKIGLVEKYIFEKNIAPIDLYIRIILRGLFYIHSLPQIDTKSYILGVLKKYTYKIIDSNKYL